MDRQGTRVNLTLPDDLVAVLDRMGKVTGAGRATIIREWLHEATPQLLEFAKALELASKNNVDAFAALTRTVDRVANDASQLSLDIKRDRRRAMRKRPK